MNYEEEKRRYVSFCGAYCRICDSFTGKKQNSAQKALRIIEKRKLEFEKLFQDEEIRKSIIQIFTKQASGLCPGCKALVNNPEEAYICKIRQCCSGKNLDLCSECEEFPCGTLINHPTAIKLNSLKNLKEIKKMGIEPWLERSCEEFRKHKVSNE